MTDVREWKDWPDAVRIKIREHEVEVRAVDDDTVNVSSDNRKIAPIVIRGVAYTAYAQIRFVEGRAEISRHGVSAQKVTPKNFRDDPSEAAHRTIGDIYLEAARIYRMQNRELMREAGRATINNQIGQVDKRIAEKQKELDDLLLEKAGFLVVENSLQEAAPPDGWRAPA